MSIIGGLLHEQTTTYTPEKRRLAGNSTMNGSSTAKRIFIFDRETMRYIASTKSDPSTGHWEITGLPVAENESLIAMYIDDTRSFNPIAFDYVSQEV